MSPPRLATRAILLHRGAVLLVNAFPDGQSDLWCLPGGGVETGQSLTETLRREVHEETGLVVEPDGICHVSEFHNAATGFHQVELFFRARILSGDPLAPWTDPAGVVTQRCLATPDDLSRLRFKPDILPELAFGPPRPEISPGALEPMVR
ncbi:MULTISPECIES: NUDIX domain-containing protein [unclassified Meridianimarinicoccus]|uniref:NUDIX domain-containing protein n=1 Tax=unclassified Meridianimarinicoccus TaxID=2923344 RepID=UPI001869069F|nr:NUDIX hydrolase [Fluviibacterium sp. MJW13]